MLLGGKTAIAVSLTEETTEAVVARMAALAPVADLFEVRADFVRDLDLAALLKARRKPILFTCRPESEGGRFPDRDPLARRRLLSEAVGRGFDLVDVEMRAGFADVVASKAGRGLVLSWHDFEGTPEDLDATHARMAAQSLCDLEAVRVVLAHALRKGPGIGLKDRGVLTPEQFLVPRLNERLELTVQRRAGVDDQRASHGVARADEVLRQSGRDQVGIGVEIHVAGRRDDVVDHQRHVVRAQERRDLPDVGGTQQRIAGYLAETGRQRLAFQQIGLLVAMGAGDIDQIVETIEKIYQEL